MTSGASLGDLFRFWDVVTGRHLLSLPAEIEGFYTRLGYSPDGNTLFAASIEGTTLIWRAPSWEEIEEAERKQDASRSSTEGSEGNEETMGARQAL